MINYSLHRGLWLLKQQQLANALDFVGARESLLAKGGLVCC